MGETERDLLERCRELESYLDTLERHSSGSDRPVFAAGPSSPCAVIRDAAAEIERQRKIEAAARAVMADPTLSWETVHDRLDVRRRAKLNALRKALEHETDV